MAHANAPLTPEGRRRLVLRVVRDGRPIAHVADEGGVSRQALTRYVQRYKLFGEEGLVDRSSRPGRSPNMTSLEVEKRIEELRRSSLWGPDRISGVAVDDRSRMAYVEAHNDERTITCLEHLDNALAFFGTHGITTVKEVLTDNGSAYRSGQWARHLVDLDIKHRRTKPHTPRTNGKAERFNLTMKNEWLYAHEFTSEEHRRSLLVPFLNNYNHDRPHSGVNNRPPISRAPMPGPRLTEGVFVMPARDLPGQMSLDLAGVTNVPQEHI